MEDSSEIELVVILLTGILLLTLIIAFILSFILIYRKRQVAFKQEKIAMQQKFEYEILQSRLETNEQTLKNISQEIHDNIGQTLTLAKLNLNPIDGENTPARIETGKKLITKAISDLRAISRSLNGNFLMELGLEEAIPRELKLIGETAKLRSNCTIDSMACSKLDPNQQIIIFRCFQECLNNSLKYAEATEISVDFLIENEKLVFEFSDNGIGFNQEKTEFGIGLRSIRERMKMLNGSLKIFSQPQAGTQIKLYLPLE